MTELPGEFLDRRGVPGPNYVCVVGMDLSDHD